MVTEAMDTMMACENDDNYTFLLRQLCNDGYMPSGPYLDDPETNEWQRANSTRVVHNPPADSGQYD